MLIRSKIAVFIAMIFSTFCASFTRGGETELAKGVWKIESFDYRGVSLDGGRPRLLLDETRDYYLRIPNDDLLKGFRSRAGLPAPGKELGGWYSADVFNVFGQIVSGLSRLHAATGDDACREKADALVAEWAKCIAADGFFYYSAKPNAPHYIYDKIVGGLVDDYLYCGNEKALEPLGRITDWAIKNLERSRTVNFTETEWYTLSENLYRAYLATGDAKYRDFAKVWEYTKYWDRYADRADIFSILPRDANFNGGFHAYSHVNTLGGAGTAYRVTGESRYLDVLKNAYDYLQAEAVFATGGYGPDECLTTHDRLAAMLYATHNSAEIPCGTWACFKMVKHLLRATGDARYGDWCERMAINGIGATIPMSAEGHVLYNCDYNPSGGAKRNVAHTWSCCTGTRPQAVADVCDLAYFKDAENLYVNLFTPSTVHWRRGEAEIAVRQITRFPEEGKIVFAVQTDRPAEFGLKIRTPAWLAEPITGMLNGKEVKLTAEQSHWTEIRRQWKKGDRLEVSLPMRLWTSRFTADRDYPAAILYGPVVLAARAPNPRFASEIDLKDPAAGLTPVAGESLTWRVTREPEVLFRPFYAYKENEPYFLYLDPAAIAFSEKPGWNNTPSLRFTNAVGATAEYAFEGVGVRWKGFKFDDAGRAEVSIDGKDVETVDQFGPGRDLPFEWVSPKLSPGKHTLRIRVLEEKTPESKDRFVNVAGFEALKEADKIPSMKE